MPDSGAPPTERNTLGLILQKTTDTSATKKNATRERKYQLHLGAHGLLYHQSYEEYQVVTAQSVRFIDNRQRTVKRTHTTLYKKMYSQKRRNKKVCSRAVSLALHLLTTVYISMLVWDYWGFWQTECIHDINVWLCVYACIQFVLTVCSIMQVCIWLRAKDPPYEESKLRLYLQYLVYIFAGCWIIYGSTFMFTDEIKHCEEPVDHTSNIFSVKALRITAVVAVAHGYVTLLWLLCLCCLGCVLYCVMTVRNNEDIADKQAWQSHEKDVKAKWKNDRI